MDTKLSYREAAESAAAVWIARRESGVWNEAAEAELRAWIASACDHRVAWLRLEAAWQQTNRLKSLNVTVPSGTVPQREEMTLPFFDNAGEPEQLASEETKSRNLLHQYGALAAGVALVTVSAAALHLVTRGASYETDIGALQAVPLADGSKITLNTDTAIRVELSQTERLINLQHGEAYFEVANDPVRPFVVDVDNKRIVAVGTEFSVRRDSDDVRIVVTEGTVRVESEDPKPMLLRAGSIARATSGGVSVQQKPLAETEQVLSWRSGYLTFDRTPLAEAVAEFNRYNVRQIVIADVALATVPVGGNFRAGNVNAFLRLIENELSVEAVERGNQILLKGGTHALLQK